MYYCIKLYQIQYEAAGVRQEGDSRSFQNVCQLTWKWDSLKSNSCGTDYFFPFE